MMDPLSAIASIIAAVQLADRVITLCKFYLEAMHDAPADLRAILIETSAVRTILDTLSYLQSCGHSPEALDKFSGSGGPIQGCFKVVTELEQLLPPMPSAFVLSSTNKRQRVQTMLQVLAWQAAAPNNACMVMGRVIGGAGCSLSATVGPMYMSEIASTSHRGLAIGMFCSCYSIGAIVMACVLLGGSYMVGGWSWRMPMTVQIVPALMVASLVFLITPESPRYLVYKGHVEQASKVIAKYHTTSESVDDPVVLEEIGQIQRSIEFMDTKPWDFSSLWKMKSAGYRLMLIFMYSFMQQCNGTGLLSYYLPGILTLVGITNTQQQLGINLGMTVAAYVSTLAGAMIIDRVTRRFLLISTMCVFIFFLGLMTVTGGLFDNDIAKNPMGYVTIVAMFLFQISNGLLSSTLHNVYPTEVLHYSQRAKGMGLYSFFQNCFGFAMMYGVGELLNKIGWKIYLMFIGINLVCLYLTWRFFPEFRFLSLEEIDYVFETTGVPPVKMSKRLQKAKVLKRKQERESAEA